MIRNRAAITASSFLSMFFIGVGSTIIGAAARNIGLTPAEIGLLMAVQNLGFIAAVMLTGALADVSDKTTLLFWGSVVLAAAFLTFYLDPRFTLNLMIMFFIGAGIGTYEGVTDAMLLDLHERRQGLYININHFFVTFGSLMITLYLIFLQMNWRRSLVQSGITVAAVALFFLLARLKPKPRPSLSLGKRMKFLLGEKKVIALFGATICAVGMELGTVGILTTYLMEMSGLNQVTSKIGLLIFLSGVAAGRVLVGVFSRREQLPRLVLLLFGGAALFLAALFFTDIRQGIYILVFFTGVTISALLPLIITLAGLLYPAHSGTVLGIIKIAIPIGGTLIPFLLSVLARYGSFHLSLALFPAVASAGFVLLLANQGSLNRSLKSTEPAA